jgi:16S rRNA processing protein RimM
MLTFKDCIQIGSFLKPYGYSGTLQLVFEPAWESSVEQMKILVTETDGLPLPWFVAGEGVRMISPRTALVDLEWINDLTAAKKLCGSPVYILKNHGAGDIDHDEPSGWEGFRLLDEEGNTTGLVTRTEDFSGNLVMFIDTPAGEKMVPFHPDLVIKTDPEERKIWMAFPEGLLEI